MRPWDEFSRCTSGLLVGDVVPSDVCGRRQPGEGDGGGGYRFELEVGGSLDHWFSCEEKHRR